MIFECVCVNKQQCLLMKTGTNFIYVKVWNVVQKTNCICFGSCVELFIGNTDICDTLYMIISWILIADVLLNKHININDVVVALY